MISLRFYVKNYEKESPKMSTSKILEKILTTCPGVVVDVGVPFLGLTVTLPPPSQLATVGHCPFSMALILCVYRMRLFYNGMNVYY